MMPPGLHHLQKAIPLPLKFECDKVVQIDIIIHIQLLGSSEDSKDTESQQQLSNFTSGPQKQQQS